MEVDRNCICCNCATLEMLSYRFYLCELAKGTWRFSFSVIYNTKRTRRLPKVY